MVWWSGIKQKLPKKKYKKALKYYKNFDHLQNKHSIYMYGYGRSNSLRGKKTTSKTDQQKMAQVG